MKAVEFQLLFSVNVWFLGPSQKEKPDKNFFFWLTIFLNTGILVIGKEDYDLRLDAARWQISLCFLATGGNTKKCLLSEIW
jgi:hypothetical protein